MRHLLLIAPLALLPSDAHAGYGTGNCTIPGAEATTCAALDLIRPTQDDVAVQDVSGDGSTIVGSVGEGASLRAARWIDGVLSTLPLPPGAELAESVVTSHDGNQVAGVMSESWQVGGPVHAYHWDAEAGYTLLDLPEGLIHFHDLSPDGHVLVGQVDHGPPTFVVSTYRWTAGGGLEVLEDVFITALATTDDAAVGRTGDGVVEWDASGTFTLLDDPDWDPAAITPDGTLIAGMQWSGPEPVAVLWEDGVLTPLALPAGMARTFATDVTADGSLVLGWGQASVATPQVAFVWQDGVPRRLADLLLQDFGLGTNGFTLQKAQHVSEDGRVLIGSGNTPTGGRAQFVAVLSPKLGLDVSPGEPDNFIVLPRTVPLNLVVFGSDQTEIADLDVASLAFGPGGAAPSQELPAGDVNGDGLLDRHFQFDAAAVGLGPTDTKACLTGRAADYPFRVCSHVTMRSFVSCGIGFELALVLPPLAWLHRRRRARRA